MTEDEGVGQEGGERRRLGMALGRWFREAFVDNAALKFVALILSLTVFFLVHTDENEFKRITIGVSYTLPEGKVFAAEAPDKVRIVLKGSKRLVKRVDGSDIEQISVSLPDINGDFVFQNNMIRLPKGLELVSINPQSFPLRLDREISSNVPIEVRTVGVPLRGFEVASSSTKPKTVLVVGPETHINRTRAVGTAELSLDGRAETLRTDVSLVQPNQFVRIDEVETANVNIEIIPRQATRVVNLPVNLVAGPGIEEATVARFAANPTNVEVTLRGPQLALEALIESQIVPVARLTATDLVPGARRATVVVRGLPGGIGIEVKPAEVALVVK